MSFNSFGKTFAPSAPLTENAEYSFTNCDTGRNIRINGTEYFTVKGGKVTIGEKEYTVLPLKNCRYKLYNTLGYLKDDDAGDTSDASIVDEFSDISAISCCWYATEKGKNQPLRMMIAGDSITLGASGDLPETQFWGCRPALTQLIGFDPLNRFVSVGSMKDVESGEDDTALFRHEGHGGWMAEDIYRPLYHRWEEDRGLNTFMEGWQIKYQPDVVLIQLGTNDCAFASGRDPQHESEWDDKTMTGVLDRWANLFELMWRVKPDLKVIVATAPPTTRSECLNNWFIEFNKRVVVYVEKWKAMGRKVIFADTNTAIYNADANRGLCSDQIHLSPAGYHAMAGVYYTKFLEMFPDGVGR